ncbi:MAG: aminopeptidase N, partial [Planctomycetes bacterium]|nr:aminopeptidase N [Planctomycetota bacterium]
MTESSSPTVVRMIDYRRPDWVAETVDLVVRLEGETALIHSRVSYRRQGEAGCVLQLDGREGLITVRLDGGAQALTDGVVTPGGLALQPEGERCIVECESKLTPSDNKSLEGLYRSSGNFCTQCEAQGFRKITPFVDRPDVLATYRVRIEADRKECPQLLANGNLVDSGSLDNGRHFAVWDDPFPKPSYLFALVAGDLGMIEDRFRTQSGRDVDLRVYVPHGREERARFALESLQRSMEFDERVYGREYDLDLFMIVAVDDFNFGAMENKGLNVFNSALVFADPQTATDTDYHHIETVVGHEYFHNWSGNRVTLRDWFQLSLKEGFTVFREQTFAAERRSAAVERVNEVRLLRTAQFTEDGGPLAHPVRPPTYQKIDNFYTATVYEKGAEVVRMMATLVGREAFRRATDLYFDRHDGMAATCEDFVCAVEAASGHDLSTFRRWYDQAGTPLLQVRVGRPSPDVLELRFQQSCRETPETKNKLPFVIPVRMGLLGAAGGALPLVVASDSPIRLNEEGLLVLSEADSVLRLVVPRDERIVPSLLRDFSAPVRLDIEEPDGDLGHRLAFDTDGFNRWDAAQTLALRELNRDIEARLAGERVAPGETFLAALETALERADSDPELVAEMLVLPDESWIGEGFSTIPIDEIHESRVALRRALGERLSSLLAKRHDALSGEVYARDPAAVGRRRLRNVALALLAAADPEQGAERAWKAFEAASCMTDSIGALVVL